MYLKYSYTKRAWRSTCVRSVFLTIANNDRRECVRECKVYIIQKCVHSCGCVQSREAPAPLVAVTLIKYIVAAKATHLHLPSRVPFPFECSVTM